MVLLFLREHEMALNELGSVQFMYCIGHGHTQLCMSFMLFDFDTPMMSAYARCNIDYNVWYLNGSGMIDSWMVHWNVYWCWLSDSNVL